MTTETSAEGAEASVTPASPRPRPVRRAPTDLPFRFVDRGFADALATEREEPDWLRAERVAAFEAFDDERTVRKTALSKAGDNSGEIH